MVFVLWSTLSAHAADYYVNVATGADTATCGSMAAPCRSINFTFTRFSPSPTQQDPAVVHVAPGLYFENAAPDAPQTGFSVPNHTHLISDNGADETVLQVDLSQLSAAGVAYVVRSQKIGMGENATDITIDGFTVTVPTGEVDLPNHEVVGINLGANFSTEIAPTGNVIRNNVISLTNKGGRTSFKGEVKGVFVTGGATIDCNVFYRIDSVGIAMGAVNTGMNGNATQPGTVTRNSFYHFTNSQNLSANSADMSLAIGIEVPTTVRGNLFDFNRQTSADRSFGVVCYDCTGLVAENNVFTGMTDLGDAPVSLVSVTPAKGPFFPLINRNTFAHSTSGLQGYDTSTNGMGCVIDPSDLTRVVSRVWGDGCQPLIVGEPSG